MAKYTVTWATVNQSPSKQQKAWRDLGIDPSEARKLIQSGEITLVHELPEPEPTATDSKSQ